MLDPKKIKQDFPILSQRVNGKELIYLDNAATSQKPQQVIDAISDYYQKHNANVHRGVHTLSDESTQIFEESKNIISNFFAADAEELILTRNATEAINGVAYGWALDNLSAGDVILTSMMEHHANIVPWQQIAKRTGAKIKYIKVTKNGKLDLGDLKKKVKTQNFAPQHGKLKLLALTHVSNTLGTVNPLRHIVEELKIENKKCKILIDGAQAVPHMKVDFKKLGVDFYAFSGHKMLGPMGVGGLLVKKELLKSEEFKPWFFGGGMIDSVRVDATKFHEDLNERFVAGTPDVANAAGLAAACKYLSNLGMGEVEAHDKDLVRYTLERLVEIKEIKLVGPISGERLGSVAFVYKGMHAHDVAQVLDSEGIALRSGHHCCMPLHKFMGWQATLRVSFQVYNSREDVDKLILALDKVKKMFL
ncbi:MAG: SufS family cysteine desulfurase [Patescibacteria group bacterium]